MVEDGLEFVWVVGLCWGGVVDVVVFVELLFVEVDCIFLQNDLMVIVFGLLVLVFDVCLCMIVVCEFVVQVFFYCFMIEFVVCVFGSGEIEQFIFEFLGGIFFIGIFQFLSYLIGQIGQWYGLVCVLIDDEMGCICIESVDLYLIEVMVVDQLLCLFVFIVYVGLFIMWVGWDIVYWVLMDVCYLVIFVGLDGEFLVCECYVVLIVVLDVYVDDFVFLIV